MIMERRGLIRWLGLAATALLVLGGTLVCVRAARPRAAAAEPAPTPMQAVFASVTALTPLATPATPAPAPEVPRTVADVQAGRAPLRVLVLSRRSMLAWRGEAPVRARQLSDGQELTIAAAGEQVGMVHVAEPAGDALRKNGENFAAVNGPIRLESDAPISLWTPGASDPWPTFPAPLIINPNADGTFSISREMPLEEYLRNVVPSEMPASFQPAALRAQAIIARTYTLTELNRHADEGADLCATVHCQAFGPDSRRSASTDEAVAATRGTVLLYRGALASTYYYSACGGSTDDIEYVWGGNRNLPYLKATPDAPANAPDSPYCKGASKATWTRSFTAAELNALVARNLPTVTGDAKATMATVTNLAIEQRTPGGRSAEFRVEGEGVSVLVHGDKVRWLFGTGIAGPNGLPSALFDLNVARDADGAITGVTFNGKGFGHGLGLCQYGADGRARAGQSTEEILRAYYPGTTLGK